MSASGRLRLVSDNSVPGVLCKVRLKPFVEVGRDTAAFRNPVEKLPVIRDDRCQPRFGNAFPRGELLCIAQQLVLKGHCRSSLLTDMHYAVCVPRLSRGYIPGVSGKALRDTYLMDLEGLKTRIRSRLKATGQSARSASLKARMGVDVIRHIFNGKSGNPKHQTIEALADALDCTPQWLTTGMGILPDVQDAVMAREEQEMLAELRDLSPEERAGVRHMMRLIKANSIPQSDIQG